MKTNMDFNELNVLITGGAGFIGSNLVESLINKKANVTVIDNLSPYCGGNLFNIKKFLKKINFIKSDISNESISKKHIKNSDIIFNLAGHISHTNSMLMPLLDFSFNVENQIAFLEYCRKYSDSTKIIYTGTRGQYGQAEYLPVDEKHPLNPTDINGINKNISETYHLFYQKKYGMDITSLRLTNIFGPRHQMKSSMQGFMNWFIRLAMDGETITLYGGGKQKRDFLFVDDCVDALLISASNSKTKGEILNIGSGKPVSVKEAAMAILKAAGKGKILEAPFPEIEKKIEIGDYWTDISKIKKLTGWSPKTSLSQGLSKTIDFYNINKQDYWR